MYDRVSAVVPNIDRALDPSAEIPSDRPLPRLSGTLASWTLQRAGHSAQCLLRTVGDRVELHITMTHDVVMSQQCSGPEEALAISRVWWSALVDRGWVEHGSHITLRAKRDRRSGPACEGLFSVPNA
jgi:hypothetical protein